MDGVYAENRLERFQRTTEVSLFLKHQSTILRALCVSAVKAIQHTEP